MGVSKNRGIPKWMIYNGKPYYFMDDLGGKPTIFGNIPTNCCCLGWFCLGRKHVILAVV